MTPDELSEMERMWREGVPIRQIARALHYHHNTVDATARRDRERFPFRHRFLTDEEWAPWIERVRSGELTPKDVREALGVGRDSVRKRMRAEGIEPENGGHAYGRN
jgi:IS30 family transposase